MKAVEYLGRVLADGHLKIPMAAKQELQLRPHMHVRVILLQSVEEQEQIGLFEAEQARKRHEAIEELSALRAKLAGKNFSLTDELLRTREMEDD